MGPFSYKRNVFLSSMDFFVNEILTTLVMFLTFFLISRTNQMLDLVLNSLAAVFITELDETLNPLDLDDTKNLM